MGHFRIIQQNFALLGISANQSRFNWKSAMAFSSYGLAMSLCSAFLFLDANTFLEYTMNIFTTSTVLTSWIICLVLLVQKDKIFEMMIEFEAYYDKSE